jgi:putative DNA primase/helicase
MGFELKDCTDVTPEVIEAISHDKIVSALLEKIGRIDFHELAHPGYGEIKRQKEAIEKSLTNPDGSLATVETSIRETYNELVKKLNSMGVSKQHYIIYSIEELLRLAIVNNWGICRNLSFIYFYNGAFWRLSDSDELKTFLSKVAEKMGVTRADAKFYKFVDDLFKQFHFDANLPKPSEVTHSTLINLQNGTFQITPEVQTLRKPDRKDFLKYQLPFSYDPNANAPIFQKFLNRVLPDVECQTVIAEYIAYLFVQSANLKLEKALFFFGSGANGKSVLFEVINALLGPENISNFSLQSLTDNTGYYRASLANKLVNYASEINGNLETGVFKQLVSGEPVEARLPYGQPFILTNYAKMIFNGNTLPKDVEHTNAYFRRFLIIPFNVTIPPEEQDKDLDKKIIANELPGIFNWVLAGLERLLAQRNFSKCDAAEKMLADYKVQSDTVALFIEDLNYTVSTTENLQLSALLSEYKTYCIENGYKHVSNRVLAERLRGMGVDVHRNKKGMAVYLTNRG